MQDKNFELIKNSPAGKFITVLGWSVEKLDNLRAKCRTPESSVEIEELVGIHIRYLWNNRKSIIEMLLCSPGQDLKMGFKQAHKELSDITNELAFEESTTTYHNKRRPNDVFYRVLGELYEIAVRVDGLYNDAYQSDKFNGLVVERLRYIKTVEGQVLDLYERRLEDANGEGNSNEVTGVS